MPCMVPMRTSTIFKSRWWALVWGAGILWTAYDFAGAQPQGSASGNNAASEEATDGTGAAISDQDAENLNKALEKF
jgi:hypothetical protein